MALREWSRFECASLVESVDDRLAPSTAGAGVFSLGRSSRHDEWARARAPLAQPRAAYATLRRQEGDSGQRFAEIAPGFGADAKVPDTRVVWLPSVRGQPLASTPVIAETPEPSAPISLAPWRVVVLRVKIPTLVDLLASTLDKKTVAPGVAVGGD